MITAKEQIELDKMLISECNQGHTDIVRELLCRGADVDVARTNGETPLHLSCRYGYIEIVKALLEKGANVDIQNGNSNTPLHMSCPFSRSN
jgi:ankyrin repeat protein